MSSSRRASRGPGSWRQAIRRMVWALAGALLLPVLLAQGRRVRRDTPRLPDASGDAHGSVGDGPPLRLVVIGESPVAGVGVATYEEALAAQLARCLAQPRRCAVHWRALGENGADARGVLERLAPKLDACDVALLVLGVNDTTHFTPLSRWRSRMLALVARLQAACGGTVIVAGVPPMHRFTALPQPLRWWIGLRAAVLDGELRRVLAGVPGVRYAEVPALVEPGHLAADGYHPGASGCAAWAQVLAECLPADAGSPAEPAGGA